VEGWDGYGCGGTGKGFLMVSCVEFTWCEVGVEVVEVLAEGVSRPLRFPRPSPLLLLFRGELGLTVDAADVTASLLEFVAG
jgi:hypothetical protein